MPAQSAQLNLSHAHVADTPVADAQIGQAQVADAQVPDAQIAAADEAHSQSAEACPRSMPAADTVPAAPAPGLLIAYILCNWVQKKLCRLSIPARMQHVLHNSNPCLER